MSKNYDDARAERDFRMNPPENVPGQGNEGLDIDIPSSGDGSNNFSSISSGVDVNSILNGNGVSTTAVGGAPVDPNQALKNYTANEDKILHGAYEFAKVSGGVFKALVASLRNNKEGDWRTIN